MLDDYQPFTSTGSSNSFAFGFAAPPMSRTAVVKPIVGFPPPSGTSVFARKRNELEKVKDCPVETLPVFDNNLRSRRRF